MGPSGKGIRKRPVLATFSATSAPLLPYTFQIHGPGGTILGRDRSPTWDTQLTVFPLFDDPDDYRVHGRAGLQAAINRHLGIRLGHDLKYDHEPIRGFRTTDTTTNVSLVLQLGHRR